MTRPTVSIRPFDPVVFWVSAGVTVAFVLGSILFPDTMASMINAMTYSFFHWGLSAWSIFALLTIALAHASFTRNLPLKFSSAFYYAIGDRIYGTWGKVLDIFAVFATLGGLATTTGFVALQLSAGLKYQYGLELGPSSTYIIIGALTAIFTLSVYTGLQKGVKLIGDINMWVFVGVWFFVLVLGPTIFLVNLTVNSLGQYLLHFIPMSLFTAPGYEGNWIGSWTVFYWAWWMSWAPFVAVFIARISRGRTIRQFRRHFSGHVRVRPRKPGPEPAGILGCGPGSGGSGTGRVREPQSHSDRIHRHGIPADVSTAGGPVQPV